MSTITPSTNANSLVRFFSNDIVNPIRSFVGTDIGQEVSDFVATAAGAASSLALIEELQPSNKTGVAQDIFTLSSAAYTLLGGASAPSLAQIQAAFAALKSDAKTTAFASLASELSTSLYAYLQKFSGSNWITVATDYVYGWQLAAQILGGAGTGSASTLLPSIALVPATPATPTPAVTATASEQAAAPLN